MLRGISLALVLIAAPVLAIDASKKPPTAAERDLVIDILVKCDATYFIGKGRKSPAATACQQAGDAWDYRFGLMSNGNHSRLMHPTMKLVYAAGNFDLLPDQEHLQAFHSARRDLQAELRKK